MTLVLEIGREEVLRLLAKGAQIVDALPEEDYAREHIAGAASLPQKSIAEAMQLIDLSRAVITYCADAQ